jgi:DNA-nicking Smr family endonuclease
MAKPRKTAPVPPDPADAELFRQAIGPVRQLVAPEEAPRAPKPAPLPRQRERDEAQALRESRFDPFGHGEAAFGETLEYLRDGLPPRVLKRLKNGSYAVQDELDLHGMNAATAERVLREFLHESRRAERYCVRVVHGKGLRSEGEAPVLKALTDRMLRQRADVLAFASARAAHGGTGAVTVLLARRRPGEAAAGDPATWNEPGSRFRLPRAD